MCAGHVHTAEVDGSAKGRAGWFPVRRAQVVLDHPYHAQMEESLIIDFVNPDRGPGARVSVELSEGSAERLAKLIQTALGHGPEPSPP